MLSMRPPTAMVPTSDPDTVDLLVVGGESDPNTRRIADHAALRGVDFVFVDTDDPDAHAASWRLDEPTLHIAGRYLRPRSLFLRHNVFRRTDATLFNAIREYSAAWPDVRVLNRAAGGRYNSKAGNLRLAQQIGFEVPATMVVDGPARLATIADLQDWVVKPLMGGAYTIPAADLVAAVHSGERAGMQLVQRRLRGRNVRVFVVGGQVFGFAIDTEHLDYREVNDCDVVVVDLDPVVEERSIELAERLGYSYCALDFRGMDADDDLVFLEINSFPMFSRFDTASGHRLADRMLSVLLDRDIGEADAGE